MGRHRAERKQHQNLPPNWTKPELGVRRVVEAGRRPKAVGPQGAVPPTHRPRSQRLHRNATPTLRKAYEIADLYKASNCNAQILRKGPPNPRQNQPRRRPWDNYNQLSHTNNLRWKSNQQVPEKKPGSTPVQTPPLACFTCGEVGHFKLNCPKKVCMLSLGSDSPPQTTALPTFQGTIFGEMVQNIIVDSGCTQSQVSAKWMPTNQPRLGLVRIQGVSSIQQLPLAKAAIRLQNRSIQPVVAVSENLQFNAILGVDVDNVLALFGSHHTWSPNPPTADDLPPTDPLQDSEENPPSSPPPRIAQNSRSPSPPSSDSSDESPSPESSSESGSTAQPKRKKKRSRPRRKCARGLHYAEASSSPPSSPPFSSSDECSSSADSQQAPSSQQSNRAPLKQNRSHRPLRKHNPHNRWGPRIPLEGGKAQLQEAQRNDPTLEECRIKVAKKDGPFSTKMSSS